MGGLPPLIGVLGENHTNGKRMLQVRLASNGAIDQGVKVFSPSFTLKDVSVLHDANGDGVMDDPAWQVLAVRESANDLRLQTRLVSSGMLDTTIQFPSGNWEGLRLDSVRDVDANISHELAVATWNRATDMRRILIKDYATGSTTLKIVQ